MAACKNGTMYVVILLIIAVAVVMFFGNKSSFNGTLYGAELSANQPESFPPLNQNVANIFHLENPDVPEEIGLGMAYPQGQGVGMSQFDSESFYPGKPGPYLTSFVNPESYGESSISDPTGRNGSDQGCRILRIGDLGNQLNFKPTDVTDRQNFAAAYKSGEVQKGPAFINGISPIDYSDNYIPEQNLTLETSPGQMSTLQNCEKTIPNVTKYGDLCITDGDIPYGQVVNGKVNPRLVSRWESYTGDYSRENALDPIDGVLYPNLSVLTQ